MDITIQNVKRTANEANGKYSYTFRPTSSNEKIKIHHMGCIGDTQLTNIQLEQGNKASIYEEPSETTRALSGIFKDLRDLNVEIREESSPFWSRMKATNKGMMVEFFNKDIKSFIGVTSDSLVSNFNKKISDVERVTSNISQKADSISATLTRTIDGVRTDINKVEAKADSYKQTLSTQINGVSTAISKVERTAEEYKDTLAKRIDGVSTSINEVKRTATATETKLSQSIDGVRTDINYFKNTANSSIQTLSSKIDGVRTDVTNVERTADRYKEQLVAQITGVGTRVATVERTASSISNRVDILNNDALLKREITINERGISLGSGKYVDGKTITNMLTINDDNITAITKKMRITGDLIVGGTIEGRHVKTGSIEAGHIKAGSVTASHIKTDAIEANHLKVDQAMIDKLSTNQLLVKKLIAQDAFVKRLKAITIDATQITSYDLRAYSGRIGSFQIGVNRNDPNQHKSQWITGANEFNVGMGDGTYTGTVLWVNWGNDWNSPGPNAWLVSNTGKMICKNTATFNSTIQAPAGMDVNTGDVIGRWSNGVEASVQWKVASDIRYKKNIDLTKVNGLNVVSEIRMVSFDWKSNGNHEKIGVIAQELERIVPGAVGEVRGYKTVDYSAITPYLIKAIQELDSKNKDLEQKIKLLEEKVNE